MFAALREGFHHTITRETATAKLTNALASLAATPEQIEDWCRAFAAYATTGGTIHDLQTLTYDIATGTHTPEQEEPLMTTETTVTKWTPEKMPDFEVYPIPNDPDRVWVADTGEGRARRYSRGIQTSRNYSHLTNGDRAAIAYFDAHPEPKPWHNAGAGTFWEITPSCDSLTTSHAAIAHGDGMFTDVYGSSWSAKNIRAARKIWPEPEESDDE